MSHFNYIAVLESGQRVTGTLRSQSRQAALQQLVHRGYHPLLLQSTDDGDPSIRRFLREMFRRVTVSDLAVFTRQMAALLGAGLLMIQALATLRRQCSNSQLVRVIKDVEEKLSRDGGTFSEALEDHPRVFDPVYRGLVRAGEESGNLAEVLSNLAKHLSQSAKLRGQVLGAFIYPIFLLVLGTAAVFVLMTFVIPRFQELFESFGGSLPLPTQILIAISSFMASWWWAVLIGCFIVILMIGAGLHRRTIRERFDRALLNLPVLGQMLLKLEISRISRTLSALLSSGVPILDALEITGNTAKNLAIKATFPLMIKGISGGEPLAAVAAKAGLYPPLMLNLIRTGEDTGQLSEMLVELSAIYEDEAERAVTGAVKLLEPLLICMMGAIIAAIIAAVILPILQANIMVD